MLVLVALTTLASCGSKESAAPSSGFTGKVQLTDEFGKPQADNSGVLVTLSDTSPQLTTQTASDGTYTLPNVPDGSHTITLSKIGYGIYLLAPAITDPHKLSTLDNRVLGQVSTTRTSLSPTVFKVVDPGGEKLQDLYLISGTVSPVPTITQPRLHRLYLQEFDSNRPGLPLANNYQLTLRGYTRPDGTFIDTVTVAQLGPANLISGNGMVVKVWATGDNPSASVYYDGLTGKLVFPAANLALNPDALKFYTQY